MNRIFSCLLLLALFIPQHVNSQSDVADTPEGIAAFKKVVSGGGGGGSDTPLVTSQDTASTLRNDTTGEVGFQFTVVGSNITVTSLGRWVVSGNSGTHLLVLRSGDCSTLIASVTVNTSGATPGQYLYGSITPVTLTAGTSYRLMSTELNTGDQWYSNGPFTTTSAANTESAAYNVTGTCGNAAANESYGPMNLKYH
jgi:hypothetical protein